VRRFEVPEDNHTSWRRRSVCGASQTMEDISNASWDDAEEKDKP